MSEFFVEDGYEATSLGQCPHKPGTESWKYWQKRFMDRQCYDPELQKAGKEEAHARAGEMGLTLHEPTFNSFGPPRVSGYTGIISSSLPLMKAPRGGIRFFGGPSLDDPITDEEAAVYGKTKWAISGTFSWDANAIKTAYEQFGGVVNQSSVTLRALWDAIEDSKPKPAEQKLIGDKPAGRVKNCHHGNVKGRCRECSGVGRRR